MGDIGEDDPSVELRSDQLLNSDVESLHLIGFL